MPRHARIVLPGVPHHVTQRGNRREVVFFGDDDRTTYLKWLGEYCAKHRVQVLAYCLMSNHVHLVAVPDTADGLERVLRVVHTRYAQRLNRRNRWKGHIWQGRYFSAALDEAWLWTAIRYVELNPVRAHITKRAQDYRWSSAYSRCRGALDPVLNHTGGWAATLRAIDDWPAWLAEGEAVRRLETLRRHVDTGMPCGSEAFVRRIEQQFGTILRARPPGRQPKGNDSPKPKGDAPL